MLDKIKNLNLNLSSPKPETYGALFNKKKQGKNYKQSNSDSLSRSDALQFLSEKNWQILEIFFPSEKKISVSFLVSEIEFNTLIDFNELNKISEISYKISSEKEINNERKRLTAFISTSIWENNQSDQIINNELKGLKLLLKRLFDLNVSNILSAEDSTVLNNIFDDINEAVDSNLNYINNCLFEFISKLTGAKINISPEVGDKQISLIKIKVETLSEL